MRFLRCFCLLKVVRFVLEIVFCLFFVVFSFKTGILVLNGGLCFYLYFFVCFVCFLMCKIKIVFKFRGGIFKNIDYWICKISIEKKEMHIIFWWYLDIDNSSLKFQKKLLCEQKVNNFTSINNQNHSKKHNLTTN